MPDQDSKQQIGEWAQPWAEWLTPEMALDGWRERIERIESQEATHFARLPYVRAVGVIGSAGRGDPWPLSDIDLLVIADQWQGQDPEPLLRAVERDRNKQLHAALIPNEVEVANWTISSREAEKMAGGDDKRFMEALTRSDWLWTAMKAHGGRALIDPHGHLAELLERSTRLLFDDRVIGIWLRRAEADHTRRLQSARDALGERNWPLASLEVLRATHDMTADLHVTWRRVPQSIMRSVTRLLSTANKVGDMATAELFLTGAQLWPEDTWRRFKGVPDRARWERDRTLAIRQGAGEHVDALGATRDLLHAVSLLDAWRKKAPADRYPEWTGVARDEQTARTQFDAARELLGHLRRALGGSVR